MPGTKYKSSTDVHKDCS